MEEDNPAAGAAAADNNAEIEIKPGHTEVAEGQGQQLARPPLLLLDRKLGGGRIDPFRTYPAQWKPFFPTLVDHCRLWLALSCVCLVALCLYEY